MNDIQFAPCEKVVIRTCGSKAQIVLKKILESRLNIDVVAFVDANERKQGSLIKGVPVISLFKAREEYGKSYAKIYIPSFIDDDVDNELLIDEMLKMGFQSTDIYWIPIECILGDEAFAPKKCILSTDYCYLNYLEYKVCDHCNLNCHGCSHFANIVDGKVFQDFSNFYSGLIKLKKIIPHIFKIRLLGGEPLLHPDLKKFIKVLRELYPYSEIRICTNGILIQSLSEDMLQLMHKENIGFDITCYPLFYQKIEPISNMLKERDIFYYVESRFTFKPILYKEPIKFYQEKLTNCPCINLYDNKLAACPLIFTIKYYNRFFDENIPEDNFMIDLNDKELTGPSVIKKLRIPSPICNYCAMVRNDLDEIPWENTASREIKKTDWYPKKERK